MRPEPAGGGGRLAGDAFAFSHGYAFREAIGNGMAAGPSGVSGRVRTWPDGCRLSPAFSGARHRIGSGDHNASIAFVPLAQGKGRYGAGAFAVRRNRLTSHESGREENTDQRKQRSSERLRLCRGLSGGEATLEDRAVPEGRIPGPIRIVALSAFVRRRTVLPDCRAA